MIECIVKEQLQMALLTDKFGKDLMGKHNEWGSFKIVGVLWRQNISKVGRRNFMSGVNFEEGGKLNEVNNTT